ncbi:MAG: MFS transporter [Xanthomonadales bacterium]|nr:MFS transporter [Xanthomonadales bacterium]
MTAASEPTTDVRREASRVNWTLASLALTMLLSSLGTSIANVGLPTLARVFDASTASVQWVVLAYLLAVTSLVVSAGRLGDLFGRRRLLLAGIALFTLASTLCGSVEDLVSLIAARTAQGAGAALMMALALAAVGANAGPGRVGRAMGLLGTVSAIGTALGPTLGGWLIADFGWSALFFVNLPLGVIAFALVWRLLPPDLPSTPARFDGTGALLLTLALVAYALAMTWGGGHIGAARVALLVAAVWIGFGFIRHEASTRSPLLQPELLRNRLIRRGFASGALAATVAMTTLVVGPFYLSGALHLDATGTGLAMSAGPLVAAIAGVPAGRSVDRWGAERMIVVGLVAMALGASALAAVATTTGVPGYVVPLMLLTTGFATFQVANNSAVLGAADSAQRGVVSGLLNLSRNLGLVTGASAMGTVFAAGESIVSGTRMTFALAAALIAVALVICILPARVPPTRLQQTSAPAAVSRSP